VYAVLTLLRYLLKIIHPQNDWQMRLETLLQTVPHIPIHSMGFPAHWKKGPIWM